MKHPINQVKKWLQDLRNLIQNKLMQNIVLPMEHLSYTYINKALLNYAMAQTNWTVTKNWLRNMFSDHDLKYDNHPNNNTLSKQNRKRLDIVLRYLNAAHLKDGSHILIPEITIPTAYSEEKHRLAAATKAKLPSMHTQAAHDNYKLLAEIYAKNPEETMLKDANGNLPIHIAALNGANNNVKILLKHNLTMLKAENNAQNNPLHLALLHEQFNTAERILTRISTEYDLCAFILRQKNNYAHQALHLALLVKNEILSQKIFALILTSVREHPLDNLNKLLLSEDKFGNSILKLVLITQNNTIITNFLNTVNEVEKILKTNIENTTSNKRFFINELKNLTETLKIQQDTFSKEELQHNEQL